jgi:hypothetical protein
MLKDSAYKKYPVRAFVGAAWVRQPAVRFDHNPSEYNSRLLRATSHEQRATAFSSRRPANCGLRTAGRQAPKIRRTTNDLRRTALHRDLRTAGRQALNLTNDLRGTAYAWPSGPPLSYKKITRKFLFYYIHIL